jgi:alpha-1,3-rhamnosyl/mannosyltransferase
MRIAFGYTRLQRGIAHDSVDGIGNYTRELYKRLHQNPALDLQPFTFGSMSDSADTPLNLGSFGAQALFSCATGLPFPSASRSISADFDLVHATDHLIPSLRRVPLVATLMDAIPLSHPEWARTALKRTKNLLWFKSAHWADHIITISNYSKFELVKYFRLPESRISVVPLGVDERWFVPPQESDLQQVKSHYALPERFYLFLGTIQPRKNIARLLLAHNRLPYKTRKECPLLIIGRAGWGCQKEINDISRDNDGTVRWLRYVQDSDLVTLVSLARALVFPSLHEGFGLPVLEAFAAGVPVITSSTTSLPEVAGESALLVDPANIEDLAEAMRLIHADDALASCLAEQGRARARGYTWNKTAAMTTAVYAQVLKSY